MSTDAERIECSVASSAAGAESSESFADAVLFVLSLGGDADTIASMTGALAGALHGASAIPEPWSSRVEGRDDLLWLADQLFERATE